MSYRQRRQVGPSSDPIAITHERLVAARVLPLAGEGVAAQRTLRRLTLGSMLPALLWVIGCRAAPKDPGVRPEPSIAALKPHVPVDASTDSGDAGATDASKSAQADAAPKLAPLQADAPLVSLPVPRFRDAIVSVPSGATEPRPTVVALHGNFDRPEWQCEVMREITNGYPFILCPRGIPRADAPKSSDRWEYGSIKQLKQELEAGLLAMRERYASHMAEGPIVMTGFSLGAILARPIVEEDPARFSRVVFTEGGNSGWNFAKFQRGGGSRVLFACAQAGCPQKSRALAKQAERVGIQVRLADGGNVGHTYDGPVAAAIKAEWPWLIEDDPQWLSWLHPRSAVE